MKTTVQKSIIMARCLEAERLHLEKLGNDTEAAAVHHLVLHISFEALARLYDRVLSESQT